MLKRGEIGRNDRLDVSEKQDVSLGGIAKNVTILHVRGHSSLLQNTCHQLKQEESLEELLDQ